MIECVDYGRYDTGRIVSGGERDVRHDRSRDIITYCVLDVLCMPDCGTGGFHRSVQAPAT